MKVIYVAGPYRSLTISGTVKNIRWAEWWSRQIWHLGAACICPHLNTALFDGAEPDELWLRGDLEILRRCDALFAIPGWQQSTGSCKEVDVAGRAGQPIFYNLDDLAKWLGVEYTTPHAERVTRLVEAMGFTQTKKEGG